MGINENKLDQFYTSDTIADKCFKALKHIINIENKLFIEPSAGGGAFVRCLDGYKFFASDIEPHYDNIHKINFLSDTYPIKYDTNNIVIGNPPFGKRSKLALEFIDKAFTISDTVAFILPLQFRKYLTQKQIIDDACLIYDEILPKDSFVYNGNPYDVRCCFQIWQRNSNLKDIRIRNKPSTTHDDFEMWQYNNTKETLKYFDKSLYNWDFAVVRQGYNDYSKLHYNQEELDRRKQWIFFKAKNDDVLNRLKSLDFVKLSKKNTSTPGFGKADVVKLYDELYCSKILTINDF